MTKWKWITRERRCKTKTNIWFIGKQMLTELTLSLCKTIQYYNVILNLFILYWETHKTKMKKLGKVFQRSAMNFDWSCIYIHWLSISLFVAIEQLIWILVLPTRKYFQIYFHFSCSLQSLSFPWKKWPEAHELWILPFFQFHHLNHFLCFLSLMNIENISIPWIIDIDKHWNCQDKNTQNDCWKLKFKLENNFFSKFSSSPIISILKGKHEFLIVFCSAFQSISWMHD